MNKQPFGWGGGGGSEANFASDPPPPVRMCPLLADPLPLRADVLYGCLFVTSTDKLRSVDVQRMSNTHLYDL